MTSETTHPILQPETLKRQKLYEMVASRIEAMIHSGELKPGDQLPSERAIMTTFNIGRPAVREALLALQNKGLITVENGRRARVCHPGVDHVIATLDGVIPLMLQQTERLKNLFDLRVFVEVGMARQAAQSMDEPSLRRLKEALDRNKEAVGNRERFMETDIAFHRVLFQSVENPVFDAIHRALVAWIMDRWRKIKRTTATETAAYEGHVQIYRAVSRRAPDAAEAAMRKHLATSWRTWAKHLGDS